MTTTHPLYLHTFSPQNDKYDQNIQDPTLKQIANVGTDFGVIARR